MTGHCLSLIACALLLATVLNANAAGRKYGNLIYPARGNIELDEGTVELWLINGLDMGAASKELAACPFDLIFPDQNAHYILNYIHWGKAIAQVGYGKLNHSYVWSPPLAWKPGEFHHLAWTWSGRKRSVYADGTAGGKGNKRGHEYDIPAEVTVEGPLVGDLTDGRIEIGRGYSAIIIDEIRISSIARTAEEIAKGWQAAPKKDATTLLLDHCEEGDPDVIAISKERTLEGELIGRRLEGGHESVKGRFGNAIQLWTE
ncbi:MAG: hypothetical protein HY360_20745 [Verrucomicrobia bacterium]|nr:hypothetical protein [Verrucomicrobiota bacterium]